MVLIQKKVEESWLSVNASVEMACSERGRFVCVCWQGAEGNDHLLCVKEKSGERELPSREKPSLLCVHTPINEDGKLWMKEQEGTQTWDSGNQARCVRLQETDPEPARHERGPHRLPPGLPEIVSGNCGSLPARLSGQRGDKAARVACLGGLSADTADRLL